LCSTDIVTFTIHSFDYSHISRGHVIVESILNLRNAHIPNLFRRLLLFATVFMLISIIAIHSGSSLGPMLYVNPQMTRAANLGATFTVQIKVASMDQFNGWDIQVATDPTLLNATSLTITGNIFDANTAGGTPFEIVHCVNGKGSGCTSSDKNGIVHSAYGNTAFASGSGLLFTIVYQVIGYNSASPFSQTPISIQNDLISSSSPSGVPHTTIGGLYGGLVNSLGGGGGTRPRQM
jgi:hypothetical protein